MVGISRDEYESLKTRVAAKRQLSAFSEVNYRIMTVFFEDGTQWTGGSMMRPDPNQAGKFIPIENGIKEQE